MDFGSPTELVLSIHSVREGEKKNTEIVIQNSGHLPNPLPQFFEPWARGDASRTEGGSGLGLPIVYQIMELHSGAVKIWEEAGSVFVKLVFPDDKKKAQSRQ